MGRRGRASHGEGENHDAAEPLLDSDHHKVDIRSIEPVSVREPREGEAEEGGTPRYHKTPGAIRLTRRVSTQVGFLHQSSLAVTGLCCCLSGDKQPSRHDMSCHD